jgi:hypothetical protein
VIIDPVSGVLTWRPTMVQSHATYPFSIVATDSGSPSMSATQYVLVTVLPPVTPTISLATFTNDEFTFSVNGDSGPDHYIDLTTNLEPSVAWLSLFTNYAPLLFRLLGRTLPPPTRFKDFTASALALECLQQWRI